MVETIGERLTSFKVKDTKQYQGQGQVRSEKLEVIELRPGQVKETSNLYKYNWTTAHKP